MLDHMTVNENWFVRCMLSQTPPTIEQVFSKVLAIPATHLPPSTPLKRREGNNRTSSIITVEMSELPDNTDRIVFSSYEPEYQDGSLNGCPEVPAEVSFYSNEPHPNPNYDLMMYHYNQQQEKFKEILDGFPTKLAGALKYREEQDAKYKVSWEKEQAERAARKEQEERELYLKLKEKYDGTPKE